ncbi:hypothetical protein CAPTEDRAFT_193741 [Capitella teleta]|uniref:Uncharacterized protein n=1 Tax=Capitella teleta TaxID=283909 RepID=R7VKK6_CAPTE|nr:hypothetical protein CAPTEDRAFT_193741 [Capitella teleta]|eukprot:ELU16840.1 hypothetical protein CAPTEDRAFT_193741 [Capitella teleta]
MNRRILSQTFCFRIDKLNSCLDDLKHLFACDPLLERSLLALFATSCNRLKSVIGMKIFPWDAVLANTLYHIYKTYNNFGYGSHGDAYAIPYGLHHVLQEFSNVLRKSIHDDRNISWISISGNFDIVLNFALELAEVISGCNCSHNENENAISIVLTLFSVNPDPSKSAEAHWDRLFKVLDSLVISTKPNFYYFDARSALYFVKTEIYI